MSIKTLNITFMRAGDRFLRLNYFQVVGDSGGKSILRLLERFLGQFNRTARHLHLLRSSVQIEQGGANFIINSAAKISELGAGLLQLGVRFKEFSVTRLPAKIGMLMPPITCHVPLECAGVTPISP